MKVPSDTASTLHHGTSVNCLLAILAEGVMRIDLGSDENPDGVSMSESLDIARGFAIQAEEFAEYGEGFPGPANGPCRGVVLTFDREVLDRLVTLRQVRWDGVSTEREVRALQPFLIEKALVSFEVGDAELAWYAYLADEFGFDDAKRTMLETLATHPLRRHPPGGDHAYEIPRPSRIMD